MYNIRSVRGIFMALIECPECHQQVSDVAEVCPHCGYPIKNHVKVKQEVVDDHKKIYTDPRDPNNRTERDRIERSIHRFGRIRAIFLGVAIPCLCVGIVLFIVGIVLITTSKTPVQYYNYYSDYYYYVSNTNTFRLVAGIELLVFGIVLLIASVVLFIVRSAVFGSKIRDRRRQLDRLQ